MKYGEKRDFVVDDGYKKSFHSPFNPSFPNTKLAITRPGSLILGTGTSALSKSYPRLTSFPGAAKTFATSVSMRC